ncbi:electron transport complex subunit RsxC [Vibrio sp. S4M6]|uniref:electron transport complex subunit RsxC n=1 Tax=Vibrio sinus TaxID=2946865 RepID=UPI00202A31E9|nr:electron transport complex subunit RsxC [Vibrio sinus]MCL9782606.1 electron transport complex subunit RsxC [Vibrio sinus]
MLSLIEQIKSGAMWDFPGGIHPPENKTQSVQQPLIKASLAKEIVLPIKQHIGTPGNLTVSVGEKVLKGQALTHYNTSFMLPVHASTSGTITAIEPRTVAHPSGLQETCIVIKPDGEDKWIERKPCSDFLNESPDELIETIRKAGVSGLGGAGFPTAKKVQSGLARTEILIVNAAECEPYITADDVLMQNYAQEIIQGIEIVEHILKPKLTVIGIEDNKPDAIQALEDAAKNKDLVIRVVPTKYPSGGEKQLIKILTNKEVPNGRIPADIGILVQNVGSLFAIKRAVCDGEPLVERIVTLTGKAFNTQRNVWAKLGTPIQSLLDEFEYKADKKLSRLILGGPMMGFTLPHANVPVTKTTNCILAPTKKEIAPSRYEMACIRCGQCSDVCPASLLPQQLQWHAKAEEYDKCEELNLKDCIECGACAYVCPSEIPLVQYYRQAKAEIRTRKIEAEASERAKQRFEEKKARQEREKAARENRFKQAAEKRRKEMKDSSGGDAIAAAIARVNAKKSGVDDGPKSAVAAAIARAKAQQAAAAGAGNSEPDNAEIMKLREERKKQARERKAEKARQTSDQELKADKKDAVAAAIARAKAKKQASQSASTAEVSSAENSEKDAKKAAVAAAIARAKAKKQASQPASTAEASSAESSEKDAKKAAVAAAIARAKAKKQASQPASTAEASSAESSEKDAKKAAVAAAIARAKAKKQASQSASTAEASSAENSEKDAKKAAVAAAIARAKAKKQANQSTNAAEPPAEESSEKDAKKAAVAAAIARAKAKKAAKKHPGSDNHSEEKE